LIKRSGKCRTRSLYRNRVRPIASAQPTANYRRKEQEPRYGEDAVGMNCPEETSLLAVVCEQIVTPLRTMNKIARRTAAFLSESLSGFQSDEPFAC
jgi:hypothetical protein